MTRMNPLFGIDATRLEMPHRSTASQWLHRPALLMAALGALGTLGMSGCTDDRFGGLVVSCYPSGEVEPYLASEICVSKNIDGDAPGDPDYQEINADTRELACALATKYLWINGAVSIPNENEYTGDPQQDKEWFEGKTGIRSGDGDNGYSDCSPGFGRFDTLDILSVWGLDPQVSEVGWEKPDQYEYGDGTQGKCHYELTYIALGGGSHITPAHDAFPVCMDPTEYVTFADYCDARAASIVGGPWSSVGAFPIPLHLDSPPGGIVQLLGVSSLGVPDEIIATDACYPHDPAPLDSQLEIDYLTPVGSVELNAQGHIIANTSGCSGAVAETCIPNINLHYTMPVLDTTILDEYGVPHHIRGEHVTISTSNTAFPEMDAAGGLSISSLGLEIRGTFWVDEVFIGQAKIPQQTASVQVNMDPNACVLSLSGQFDSDGGTYDFFLANEPTTGCGWG